MKLAFVWILVLTGACCIQRSTAKYEFMSGLKTFWKTLRTPWVTYSNMRQSSSRQAVKDLWTRAKMFLFDRLNEQAVAFANSHSFSDDQLKGFLFINRELVRYHWVVSKRVLEFYLDQVKPNTPEAMIQFMTKHTRRVAMALKPERIYNEYRRMPNIDRIRYNQCRTRIDLWPIPYVRYHAANYEPQFG